MTTTEHITSEVKGFDTNKIFCMDGRQKNQHVTLKTMYCSGFKLLILSHTNSLALSYNTVTTHAHTHTHTHTHYTHTWNGTESISSWQREFRLLVTEQEECRNKIPS